MTAASSAGKRVGTSVAEMVATTVAKWDLMAMKSAPMTELHFVVD